MFYKKKMIFYFKDKNLDYVLIIIMTGEITIAQKRKSKETCRQNLQNKDGTCEPKSCEA